MNGPFARLLSVGVSVGFISFMLARTPVGWWLIAVVTAIAALCCATIYVLRYEASLAKQLYSNSIGRPVLDALCGVTGEQKPGGVKEAADRSRGGPAAGEPGDAPEPTYSVLRTESDFEIAGRRLKETVVGHDHVVDAVLSDLHRGVMVRIKRPDSGGSLLGSYLLYGPIGVGKRLLACTIAQELYPKGEVLLLDGREYMDVNAGLLDLFGTRSAPGRLLGAVKRQPLQTVVFESVDSCHPEVLERLAPILLHGGCVDPGSGGTVSFEHCVFFFLSTKLSPVLEPITSEWGPGDAWLARAMAMLTSTQKLNPTLLDTLHVIVPMHPLNPMERAEVIVRLIAAECQRYRVQLKEVDPEVVAEQVSQISNERGFEGVHARIKSLLREDLARAVEISMPQLTVRKKARNA